jgi:hypothetical protein
MSGGYSGQSTRPWILSAVGITSVIIASISLIADFISLSVANFLTAVSAMGAMPPPPAPVPMPAVVHQAQAEFVGATGLSSGQRQAVIDGLVRMHELSDARRQQLDALLADDGQDIIRLSPENLTADRVAAYATGVSEIPSGSGATPDVMFMLGSGRLQLSDQEAVFFPDNSPSPIRSVGGSFTDSGGTHLATEQINAIVDRVRQLSNQTINDAQVNSLEAELESVSQTLITPTPSVTEAAAQVLSAGSLPDGTIFVTTRSGSMSFATTGQSYLGITAMSGMQGPFAFGKKIQRRDTTLLMADALLSMGASGLLLACGIMTLRNIPASRWMHMGYAVGKLAIVVLSCYAIFTVAYALDSGSAQPAAVATTWMLLAGGIGAIYPVVLLVSMNLKAVREFLATPTVARIF